MMMGYLMMMWSQLMIEIETDMGYIVAAQRGSNADICKIGIQNPNSCAMHSQLGKYGVSPERLPMLASK